MGIQQWRLREQINVSSSSTVSIDDVVSAEDSSEIAIEASTKDSVVNTESSYGWSDLIETLSDKESCSSCSQVTPILGEGDINADWMFVFDSPSLRDIEQQTLLTGRVGQLFDAILLALGLSRENVYLSSIFKCPPAADITAGTAQCDGLLQHQIRLVNPRVVIAFGEFVGQSLVKANEGLEQLRQQQCQCFNLPITVIPTYGLMQMLDTPEVKGKVWEDLKSAIKKAEI